MTDQTTQQQPNPGRDFTGFFRFTTTRPVAILMVVMAVMVFGWVCYDLLSLNLMPDISYPSLTVRTTYPGTAPEEVETVVSRPVEQSLGVVNKLVRLSSISKAGMSDVILEFEWDTDMNFASQDVREKLDQVFLPPEVKRPIILRYDPTLDPILRFGIYGNASLYKLRRMSEEEIQRDLEGISGVAAVRVKGGLEEEIRIELDERQLTLLGMDIQQVNTRLLQENVNLAGGNLKEGQTEYLVRTLNEFKDIDQIADIVIAQKNGADVRLRDIAAVSRTHKEREVITRINGQESVEIEIFKEADANLVAVAGRVKERVFGTEEQKAFVQAMKAGKEREKSAAARKEAKKEEKSKEPTAKKKDDSVQQAKRERARASLRIKRMTNFLEYQLPEGVEMSILSDQSVFIRNAIDEVKSTAMMGGVLAIIVLYVFLRRIWNTIIVAVAIPVSIVATFAPMYLFDVSLNIMSLGGLALGIGMLVDNSIVVLESIFRCREEGDSVVQGAIRGTGEVGGAVFASTLTTIAVFLPIVFVEGVAGQVFGDMALTVVFSLLASLAVALFVIPMLASRGIKEEIVQDVRARFSGSHILRLESLPEVRSIPERLRGGQRFRNVPGALRSVLRLVLEMTMNVGIVVATMLLVVVKFLVVTVVVLTWPLAALAMHLLRKEVKVGAWVTEWAGSNRFFKVSFQERVWDNMLRFLAVPAFVEGQRNFFNRFRAVGWGKRILRGLSYPFVLVYDLVRLVLHLATSLFMSKVLFLLLVAAFYTVFATFTLLGVILAPFALAVLAGFNWILSRTQAGYPGLVRAALSHKAPVLLGAFGLFIVSWFLIIPNLGRELIPEVHQGEFNVEVRLPVGAPVELTAKRLAPLEAFVRSDAEVKMVSSVVGMERTAQADPDAGEHFGKMTVLLSGSSDLAVREDLAIGRIRRRFRSVPDTETKISRPVLFSFKTPVEVEIKGYNLDALKRISRRTEEELAAIEGLYDVKANIQQGNPEIQIRYDRQQLSRYGLNILDVATLVRNKVQGNVPTEFREADRKIDILVRLKEKDKASIDNLRRLVVNPNDEIPVPLSAVADIRLSEGPSEIRRIDQQRSAVITANINGIDLGTASQRISAALQTLDFPDDFTYAIAGQNQEMQTSLSSLLFALALAVFLIYVVMASQFESLVHPFVIMFTIPLAVVGVAFTLWSLSIPLSVVVFIGLIMLAGIVVNNAIVLVDYINRLRRTGMEKVEAIVQAGRVRLRPILMTTMTTVLGLLPMALGLGEGAEIRTPMAITVIAGLISSTILTLVVIPTVYAVVDRSK